MGHNRLGILPKTRRWREVVALLEDAGSRTTQIASATVNAAQTGLQLAKVDEGLSHAFWLLCQIPLAAKQRNFAKALRDVGVDVPDEPSTFDIAAGVPLLLRQNTQRTDRKAFYRCGKKPLRLCKPFCLASCQQRRFSQCQANTIWLICSGQIVKLLELTVQIEGEAR